MNDLFYLYILSISICSVLVRIFFFFGSMLFDIRLMLRIDVFFWKVM